MCGVERPYSSVRRLAAFYPFPQMLAVCYQLDTASEETGSGKDGLQSPSTQHSTLACSFRQGAQHQRGAPQSVGCHGVQGTSQAALPALFDLCAPAMPREEGREARELLGLQQPGASYLYRLLKCSFQ